MGPYQILKKKIISLQYYPKYYPFPFREMRWKRFCGEEISKIDEWVALDDAAYEQLLIKRLRETVDFAFEYVPYYREKYRAAGYEKGGIQKLSDMLALPLLRKADIKENVESFYPVGVDIPYTKAHTGGSTDTPLDLRHDDDTVRRDHAFFYYYWKQMGFTYGKDKCVWLLGTKLSDQYDGQLYDYDNFEGWMRVDSSYVTDPARAAEYKAFMEPFHAKAMKAYTSFAYSLARSMEAAGIEPPQFDYIILSSENMYPDQMRYLKEAYRAKDIIYHYGQSERVSFAAKFPGTDYLGFMQTFGYTELLDHAGNPVEKAGQTCQIVGTSYDRAMPLIRYCTNDYAIKSDYKGTGWMRHSPAVERIEGRGQEFLVTKSGMLMSPLMVSENDTIASLKLIGEAQYYQDAPGQVTVRVSSIDGKPIQPEVMRMIQEEYDGHAGEDFVFRIEQVDEIKRTGSNKRMMVEQKLDLTAYQGRYASDWRE